MKKNLKVGVVCSTAGSAILAALDIFNSVHPDTLEIVVATDRECEIESECKKRNITYQRIIQSDNHAFTSDVTTYFKKQSDISLVLLFFSRLVTSPLHNQIPTLNIHPSLLPAFPGMNAVQEAYESGAKFLGASLHIVDKTTDAGPLIAQTVHPLIQAKSLRAANRLAFSQKVYLTVLLFEMLHNKKIKFIQHEKTDYHFKLLGEVITTKSSNPALQSLLLKTAFNDYLIQQNLAAYQV